MAVNALEELVREVVVVGLSVLRLFFLSMCVVLGVSIFSGVGADSFVFVFLFLRFCFCFCFLSFFSRFARFFFVFTTG